MSCLPLAADTYPVESLPNGWITASVAFQHKDGTLDRRVEIIDLKTKKRFAHEPMRMIAVKCSLLALLTPLYLMTYIGFHLLRIPITALNEVTIAFDRFFHKPSVKNLGNFFRAVPERVLEGFWTIVRAPFYSIGIQFAALYGIFFPLEGRSWVGAVEEKWHQKTYRNDLQFMPVELPAHQLWKALSDPDFRYAVFLAFCMQPHGKTTDPHIRSIEEIPHSL